MRGIVAASGETAPAAGAEVLARGGNAADAAVAAMATVFVSGPVLSSPGGGGVAVVHDPVRGCDETLDFFARVPGLPSPRLDPTGADFREVRIHFDSQASQPFHIGKGSTAVPGCLAGLLALHRRHGRLPLEEVLEVPARHAREGVVVSPLQARYHQIFAPILTATPELAAQVAGPDGGLSREGDRLRAPAWAETLEEMGRSGVDPLLQGSLRGALLRGWGPPAGFLTPDDLDAYAVRTSPPLRVDFRGRTVLLPGFPSEGSGMVAFLLLLVGTRDPCGDPRAPERFRTWCAALETTLRARAASPPVTGPGSLEHWVDPDHLERWAPTFEHLLAKGVEGSGAPPTPLPGNTTHVSCVDADGLAVAMTTSFGESCGAVLPELGRALNNFLGEDDINPRGFHADPPGSPMGTMMCPTVVLDARGAAVAFGTGGSNRIKSVIPQVVANLVDHHMEAEEAVLFPRIHRQPGEVLLEGEGLPGSTLAALRDVLPGLKILPTRHLYFGGVHLAARDREGGLHGTGDPRREGGVAACPEEDAP